MTSLRPGRRCSPPAACEMLMIARDRVAAHIGVPVLQVQEDGRDERLQQLRLLRSTAQRPIRKATRCTCSALVHKHGHRQRRRANGSASSLRGRL